MTLGLSFLRLGHGFHTFLLAKEPFQQIELLQKPIFQDVMH